MSPAISLEHVHRSLGGEVILGDVSLSIAHGQSCAIVGPSGSGKSSLMAVLSGLERASGGALTVAGADFTNLTEDGLAALQSV